MNEYLPTQQQAGHVPSAIYTQAMQQAAPGAGQPVIVVQAPQPQRRYGGLLLTAGIGGVLLIGLLLSIAVVATAVAVGAISCSIGWLVIRGLMKGGK